MLCRYKNTCTGNNVFEITFLIMKIYYFKATALNIIPHSRLSSGFFIFLGFFIKHYFEKNRSNFEHPFVRLRFFKRSLLACAKPEGFGFFRISLCRGITSSMSSSWSDGNHLPVIDRSKCRCSNEHHPCLCHPRSKFAFPPADDHQTESSLFAPAHCKWSA